MSQYDNVAKKCLEELKPVFTVRDFKNALDKTGTSNNKKPHYILGKLVQQKYLEKIDKSTYQKVADMRHPTLEFFKKFIDQCQNDNKVQEISKCELFYEVTTAYFVGVPEDHHLPEWKKEVRDLLLERMMRIFESMDYLVTNDHSKPTAMPDYLRQMMLEIIPHYLDLGAHLHFYKLRDEIEGLIQAITLQGHDTTEMVKRFDKIKKWTDNPNMSAKSRKITDKLGLMILPPLSSLDPDSDAERSVLDNLREMNSGKAEEAIVAELATWEEPIYVSKILRNYENVYDVLKMTKIKQLYEKIQLGMKVAPLLYSLDFHLKALKGLENKTLSEGTYWNGKHVSEEQDPEAHNMSIAGCLIFDAILASDGFVIPSEEFCEREISEKVGELGEIKKSKDIKTMIESSIFQNKIKLINSVPFSLDNLDFKTIFEYMGCGIHVKDIPKWVDDAAKDADRFVEYWGSWMNRKSRSQ